MKYFIIAGESSGELHGSHLMSSLMDKDPDAEFRYWGGDKMHAIAPGRIVDIKDTAVMGFVAVARSARKFSKLMQLTKAEIKSFAPDVVIFIDYSGFNLRMAKWVKTQGYKTQYYISPQLWAWKGWRVKAIKKHIDQLAVILPFEKQWYAERGVIADYVGHPLMDYVNRYEKKPISGVDHNKPLLALLPGSREQEIRKILPTMLQAADRLKGDYSILLACTAHTRDLCSSFIKSDEASLIVDRTYDVLSIADSAFVTSGTATLETALFNVPQVICYKTSSLNYMVGKRMVNLNHIGLPNIVSNKEIVPELVQNDLSADKLISSLQQIESNKQEILKNYAVLKSSLSNGGKASDQVAELVLKLARK